MIVKILFVICIYVFVGICLTLYTMLKAYADGKFNPNNVDAETEEAIGELVFIWPKLIFKKYLK